MQKGNLCGRDLAPCYLSDVVTSVAWLARTTNEYLFSSERRDPHRERAHTTGDHHVLRSAAAVHMADEKVTVALHLRVTLHYHAIITRLLSFLHILHSLEILPILRRSFNFLQTIVSDFVWPFQTSRLRSRFLAEIIINFAEWEFLSLFSTIIEISRRNFVRINVSKKGSFFDSIRIEISRGN